MKQRKVAAVVVAVVVLVVLLVSFVSGANLVQDPNFPPKTPEWVLEEEVMPIPTITPVPTHNATVDGYIVTITVYAPLLYLTLLLLVLINMFLVLKIVYLLKQIHKE